MVNVGKIAGYAAKAVGVAGLCVAAYDGNYKAKSTARKSEREANANAKYRYFVNTQYNPNASHFTTKMKNKLFKWELTERLRGIHNYNCGYLKGFFGNLKNHILPIGLSAAALLTKGKLSMAAAIGLGIYGLSNTFSHINKKP